MAPSREFPYPTMRTCSTDDVWVVDSSPVQCGRLRETAERSDLAGWAEWGYGASRSRYFWGLRLRLLRALSGLPVAFAPGAKPYRPRAQSRHVEIRLSPNGMPEA